jgi:hypothetical protein
LNIKSYIDTYRQLYVIICFFLIYSVFSQSVIKKNPSLLKAVITSVGSSSVTLKTPTKNYYIQQSIGQSGMIGLATKNNLYVQQGFLNNAKIIEINNLSGDFEKAVSFTVYPNPAVEYVKILFTEKPTEPIQIGFFDVAGRLVFTEKHPPSLNLTIPIVALSEGVYLMYIMSGKSIGSKKIVKINQ